MSTRSPSWRKPIGYVWRRSLQRPVIVMSAHRYPARLQPHRRRITPVQQRHFGWTQKKPSGSGGTGAGSPKYQIANGRAISQITMNVRDDTPQGDGNTWNPVQFENELLKAAGSLLGRRGGHVITLPSFGHNHHGYWSGSKTTRSRSSTWATR
jgi:hypothetical protein